ncbi:prefoldin subunit alpha [Candidatus Woesearchaeota archaeon]|jgi:prefoldin alpha subunit|nr:prefoldin subunit alpha [Candidatus Woesearchaeota archaeon]|tara:strand:- start:12548 stop:12961 length:414 start_codon:yes stop_codon:yes gene_type:complete
MDDKEKKAHEMYVEYQALDQHIKQLQKQLEVVTNQLMELSVTSNGLEEFKKINDDNEIFVPLSSGIFAKASVKDKSKLLVNVGANVAVQKDVPSTKKLIHTQIEELTKIQKRITNDLEKMAQQAAQIEMELQSLASK